MNNGYFAAFIAGVAIGGLFAWYRTKCVYEKILDEEIASVKKAFSDKKDSETEEEKEPEIETEENNEENVFYKHMASEYADFSENVSDEKDKPYIITPDEFGEFSDYETISLTYFADKVLADDDYNIIDDGTIDREVLSHFGEYEDESVFVRNDKLKTDFEILLDNRKYTEAITEAPYLRNPV